MFARKLPDDFYDRIKPRLYASIAGELRSARRVFDLGCGGCELVRRLVSTHNQGSAGLDTFAGGFPVARRTSEIKTKGS